MTGHLQYILHLASIGYLTHSNTVQRKANQTFITYLAAYLVLRQRHNNISNKCWGQN